MEEDKLVYKPNINDLKCSICMEIQYEPMLNIKCFHSFCKKCIGDWKAQNNNCPECRVGPLELYDNLDMTRRINNYVKVRCKYSDKCSWTGTYYDVDGMKKHAENCKFVEVCVLCKACVSTEELYDHVKDNHGIEELYKSLKTLTRKVNDLESRDGDNKTDEKDDIIKMRDKKTDEKDDIIKMRDKKSYSNKLELISFVIQNKNTIPDTTSEIKKVILRSDTFVPSKEITKIVKMYEKRDLFYNEEDDGQWITDDQEQEEEQKEYIPLYQSIPTTPNQKDKKWGLKYLKEEQINQSQQNNGGYYEW